MDNCNHETFTVSISVDGRIDVEVSLPANSTKEEIRKAALFAFGSEDLSNMEVVGSNAVNCSDKDGELLFDFD